MISIFVHAEGKGDENLIGDHYQFEAVPAVGETVIIDDNGSQYELIVTGVTHLAKRKDDKALETSNVMIACKVA